MPYILGGLALVALAGVVLLVRYVSKGGGPRTALWAVLLIAAVLIVLLTLQVASIVLWPIGWIIAIASEVLVIIALIIRVGRDVSWKAPRVLGLVGLLLLSLIMLTVVMIAAPFGEFLTPLFETRAQILADRSGFDVLVAADEKLDTQSLPVDTVRNGEGLSLSYKRFVLQERKANKDLSAADLEKIAAPGQDVTGFGLKVPTDATYEEFQVDGKPALGVEYNGPGGGLPGKQSTIRILVFGMGGTDVRIYSESHMQYMGGNENYELVDALSFDEMVKIAGSLEPLK